MLPYRTQFHEHWSDKIILFFQMLGMTGTNNIKGRGVTKTTHVYIHTKMEKVSK